MHPLGGQNRLVVANLRPKIKLMSNALVTINNSATTILENYLFWQQIIRKSSPVRLGSATTDW